MGEQEPIVFMDQMVNSDYLPVSVLEEDGVFTFTEIPSDDPNYRLMPEGSDVSLVGLL